MLTDKKPWKTQTRKRYSKENGIIKNAMKEECSVNVLTATTILQKGMRSPIEKDEEGQRKPVKNPGNNSL
jgi:hypothetical protein